MTNKYKKFPKKLLVEGKDDLYVIAGVRDGYKLPANFEIIDCEGVENISDNLLAYIKSRQEVIGVVVDADADTSNIEDSLKARWDSLRDVLANAGYQMPKIPNVNGTIIEGNDRNPRIGIWLMPDNVQQPGMLEDFATTLIPLNDLLKPVAEQVLAQIGAMRSTATEQSPWFKPIHHSKALIHTWLAWQESPGTPMGLAITKTYLDHNTELCRRFADWLQRLFN
ncbi:MAG: hypothetical protein LH609_23880 [Rudanella sp.]|nr:hypothetical protein [Rudanella sp.]